MRSYNPRKQRMKKLRPGNIRGGGRAQRGEIKSCKRERQKRLTSMILGYTRKINIDNYVKGDQNRTGSVKIIMMLKKKRKEMFK